MIDRVIQDITQYLTKYLDSAIFVALVFSFGRFIISFFFMLREPCRFYWRKWIRMLVSLPIDFAAVFYFFMVIVITFFSRMEGSVDVVNLRLFSTFGNDSQSKLFIIENIVMFIPMGALLCLYGIKRLIIAGGLMLGASVLIEVMQYLTGRGRMEIDDVLTNMIGGIAGFILISFITNVKYMVKKRSKK